MMQRCRVVITAVLALAVSVSVARAEALQSADERVARAVVLLQEGILFEAIHELERVAVDYPDHEGGRMLLARSLYRVKREARAAEEAAQVMRINPDNMEARRLLTRIRGEIGQRLDRKDHAAVLQYARLCSVPGSYDRAADFYRMALAQEDSAPVHLEFARMLSWAGHQEESARHYELFLESNPDNAEALSEVGRVYNASGRFVQAISAFESSLKIRSGDLDTALDLIRALVWSGKEAEAQERLQAMIRKQVGGDKPLMLLASIAHIQERFLDEYELLVRVVAENPGNTEARQRIQELEGGTLLAVARLVSRLEQEPDNVGIRRQLAELYIADSRFGEALYHLDLICKRMPDDQEVQERRRWLRAEEGRLVMDRIDSFHGIREADRRREIAMLSDWLGRNTGDMKSRERLAELLIESGAYDESVVQMEWLEAAAPGNVQIAQALQRVRSIMKEREENNGSRTNNP
jgi:tetratricopeptide (TPR) repeat protein